MLEETPQEYWMVRLEACGVEFPDEASRAELQEMGLTGQLLICFFQLSIY